jgi:hypothetical protein
LGEGRRRRRCGEDGLPNAFDISKDFIIPSPSFQVLHSKYFIIPETQHTIAMIGKPSIADDVASVSRALAAINFDDKPLFATHKVNDIGADRLLADEFEAG